MRAKVGATILVLAIAACPPRAASQVPVLTYRDRLLGVFNGQTGEPVEAADVIDVLTKTSARTTSTGTVTLTFLPEGVSIIRVQKVGYQPHTMTVQISPADTVPITIVLTSLAQSLPEVVTTDTGPRYVSPGLRAFEERRREGIGRFVSEAELRKHPGRTMTNVVQQHISGIRIVCERTGRRRGECWPAATRVASRLAILGDGPCAVDVYIDGVISTDNNLERIRSDEFSGVEFYSGGARLPAQYNRTGAACGVLLLWTRER